MGRARRGAARHARGGAVHLRRHHRPGGDRGDGRAAVGRGDRGAGPDAVVVQRHLPGAGARRRRPRPRHLQARAGRAAAVGLPQRPVATRGGHLRAVGGAGLRPRAAHRRPRGGADGPGFAPGVRARPVRGALLHAARHRRPRTRRRPAGAVRARPGGQLHRPQGRPLPHRRRRPGVGHRQRPELPRGVQAAHGDLGLRRPADHRRAARAAAPPERRRGADPLGAVARAARDRCRAEPHRRGAGRGALPA